MATEEQINQLDSLGQELGSLDKELLFREKIGSLSLTDRLSPLFDEVTQGISFSIDYGRRVSSDTVNGAISNFGRFISLCNQLIQLHDNDYAANRDTVIIEIEVIVDSLRKLWPEFDSAERGLRRITGEKPAPDISELKKSISTSVESAKTEVENMVAAAKEEAHREAEAIKSGARKTAAGISVEAAQDQFREAQDSLDRRKKWWAWLSIMPLVAFFAVCASFFSIEVDSEKGYLSLVYHTTLRVTILMALGTISAFCLRIFRAHLHMSEKNNHRQRVANCIEAFVNSTSTDEQRDLILGQLVEAVVQFGNSGLLPREEDNVYRPKMTIDTILKSLHPIERTRK